MISPSPFGLPAALAVLAGCGAAASTVSQPLVIDQGVTLEEGGTLSVDNVAGEIRVKAWDKDTVHVHAEKTGTGADEIEVRIEADPRHLRIRTIYPRLFWGKSGRVTYRIQVPRQRLGALRLANVSGDLAVSGLKAGGFRLRSVSGALSAEGCEGPVEAGTVSGVITLGVSAASVAVETVSGNATLSLTPTDPAWRCHLKTVSGDLALALPKGAGARLVTSTVSGRIRHPGEGAAFGDGSGRLQVETVSGDCRVGWSE